jgi:HlyD family secretion protein
MNVDVDIVVAEADAVLQIPAVAVASDGRGPFVYKIEGDRVRVAFVQLGLTSITAAEITAGLEVGARIVRAPLTDLHDGMRIEIHENDGSEP